MTGKCQYEDMQKFLKYLYNIMSYCHRILIQNTEFEKWCVHRFSIDKTVPYLIYLMFSASLAASELNEIIETLNGERGGNKHALVSLFLISIWIIYPYVFDSSLVHLYMLWKCLSRQLMHWDTFNQDNSSTVGGDGGCRVGEVWAGTTSPIRVLSYSNLRSTHSISQ